MSGIQKIELLLLGVLWGVIWVAKTAALPLFGPLILGFIALLTLLMVVEFVQTKKKWLLFPIAAYALVWIGDFFLNFTPYAKLHIASFATAHLVLVTGFFKEIPFTKDSLKYAVVPVVISAILYGVIVGPALPHPLAIPFLIYVTLLALLIWRTYCYTRAQNVVKKRAYLLFIGAVLFYITDVLVGIRIIYAPDFINSLVYLVYPPALIMIARSSRFAEVTQEE